MSFYSLGLVVGDKRNGYTITFHDCERGSCKHRQGDLGKELVFISRDIPNAKYIVDELLKQIEDKKA